MTKDDKKLMREVFNDGFDKLILPQFDRIYNTMATKEELEIVKKDVSELKEDVAALKEGVSVLKEDVSIIKDDVEQINRKLDTEVAWKDEASIRLHKLELKTGITK